MKTDLLERAIEIAVSAHKNQKDKSGEPYVLHPLRMMSRARSAEEKMVAVLHDVVEDNEDWTIGKLRKEGFPQTVVDAVEHLTKREGEDYDDFVERAMRHPLAKSVKLLDLEDNMDVLRFQKVDAKAAKKLAKYLRAWHRIVEE